MKKSLLLGAICALAAPSLMADVTLKMPADIGLPNKINVERTLIADWAAASNRSQRKTVRYDVTVTGRDIRFDLDSVGPAFYKVTITPQAAVSFFAAPDENITFNFTSLNPLDYTATGSGLIEGMNDVQALTAPIEKRFEELTKAEQMDENALQAVMKDYDDAVKGFIASNPDSPAVAYLLLNMDGEDFINTYNALSPKAKESYLMPLIEQQKERVERRIEQERKQKEMTESNVEAPAFTLKNTEGKDVSLSDFRGKWVILDFWGTWCPWCIKGFPKLKEAYSTYKDKLEVIGIDCRDSEKAWKDGVVKHELPWVNVYNPDSNTQLLEQYQVQGFPTKVLVNPEGRIAAIATGEDPTFYTRLSQLIK